MEGLATDNNVRLAILQMPPGSILVAWHGTAPRRLTGGALHFAHRFSLYLRAAEQDTGGTYHLNHWAIAWNLPGTDPSDLAGLINITEVVTVDRSGNSMTGTVALDLYAPDGTTHLAHLVDGTVAGSRVTAP